nr:hypothetical protein [Brochothrix campestris]
MVTINGLISDTQLTESSILAIVELAFKLKAQKKGRQRSAITSG